MNTSSKLKVKSEKLTTSDSPMARLWAQTHTSFYVPKKGEFVKGVITKLTSAEILVDINAKTEAVVFERDRRILRNFLSTLREGENVEVTILNPESETGNPVVSLRRFTQERNFHYLEEIARKKTALHGVITEITKGGFIVDTDLGISGFLPNSQSTFSLDPHVIGKKVEVYAYEINKALKKIVFSQKKSLDEEQFKKMVEAIKVGQKISATITNITTFGIFVSIPLNTSTVDGLIHISEISWGKVEHISEAFTVGQTVEALVIALDSNAKRVDLSLKRLTEDPFASIIKDLRVDQTIEGTVSEVGLASVIVEIVNQEGRMVEGIIRKEKIPPNTTYKKGDTIHAVIAQIDEKRRKLILVPSLKEKPIGYR